MTPIASPRSFTIGGTGHTSKKRLLQFKDAHIGPQFLRSNRPLNQALSRDKNQALPVSPVSTIESGGISSIKAS